MNAPQTLCPWRLQGGVIYHPGCSWVFYRNWGVKTSPPPSLLCFTVVSFCLWKLLQ